MAHQGTKSSFFLSSFFLFLILRFLASSETPPIWVLSKKWPIWGRERDRAGFAPRDLVHPIPPSLFTCNFVWVDATPEKRVLAASGDTDNRHQLPTHAAGGPQVSPGASLPGGVAIRGAYPRRRRAPCLGGSCRRVGTLRGHSHTGLFVECD